MLQLQRTVEPALPFVLSELKDHLAVESDFIETDTLMNSQAASAMSHVEEFLSRSLMPQTWQMNLDRFPGHRGVIKVPRPPLQSVTSITYIDCNGVQQTLANTEYKVDSLSEPARIVPEFDKCWPDTREEIAAVSITFVAGYVDANSVPNPIKQAILLILGSMYRDRENSAPVTLNEIPMSAKNLLYPYRIEFFQP